MDLIKTEAHFDPAVYGRLLASELPRLPENETEYDRIVERMEALDFPPRQLTPEESALRQLLAALVQVYEPVCESPDYPPCEVVKFFMEQRGLKQADLVPVLGTRSQVSDIVTGKRGISKAQAKKLATFFNTGVELFI